MGQILDFSKDGVVQSDVGESSDDEEFCVAPGNVGHQTNYGESHNTKYRASHNTYYHSTPNQRGREIAFHASRNPCIGPHEVEDSGVGLFRHEVVGFDVGEHDIGEQIKKMHEVGEHDTEELNEETYGVGEHDMEEFNEEIHEVGEHDTGGYNEGEYNELEHDSGVIDTGEYNGGDHNEGEHDSGVIDKGDYNGEDHNEGEHDSGVLDTEDNEADPTLKQSATTSSESDISLQPTATAPAPSVSAVVAQQPTTTAPTQSVLDVAPQLSTTALVPSYAVNLWFEYQRRMKMDNNRVVISTRLDIESSKCVPDQLSKTYAWDGPPSGAPKAALITVLEDNDKAHATLVYASHWQQVFMSYDPINKRARASIDNKKAVVNATNLVKDNPAIRRSLSNICRMLAMLNDPIHLPLFMATKGGHEDRAMLDNGQIKWKHPCWVLLGKNYSGPNYHYNHKDIEAALAAGDTSSTATQPKMPQLPNVDAWNIDLAKIASEEVPREHPQKIVNDVRNADPMNMTPVYAVHASCANESEFPESMAKKLWSMWVSVQQDYGRFWLAQLKSECQAPSVLCFAQNA
ncbi:hypothetical protein SARC_05521 [Sphaeroforma arctica JP610]|uniref:Uncharacterized protein n=1 Tax=Sphaeroforma arctica JP610 TaxID=667725 RepID=A0A0L0FZC3_9EUKA|nr:hypothetical protein SARC_05521 [Sphaeroforma arctica JP610]KNC82182.1 hypothetical protein SARC_05521 [Sphaeroforma arctica JP610]|eukprot:XP_014156084.1 hypothetical protein SARC_05521 [Sphaeroforma arctica JP610]